VSFTDQYAVGQDPTFKTKVEVGILKVAGQVQGEAMAAMTQAQWRKRASLAQNVILGGGPLIAADGTVIVSWVDQFSIVVPSANATITLASSDADIEFQIAASWDDMAGVTGEDLQAQ